MRRQNKPSTIKFSRTAAKNNIKIKTKYVNVSSLKINRLLLSTYIHFNPSTITSRRFLLRSSTGRFVIYSSIARHRYFFQQNYSHNPALNLNRCISFGFGGSVRLFLTWLNTAVVTTTNSRLFQCIISTIPANLTTGLHLTINEFTAILRHYALTSSVLPFTSSTKLVNANSLSRNPHILHFRFLSKRLSISLLHPESRKSYFTLRPGLLLKHMGSLKKGSKSTLSMKLLLVRFVRKLLLIANVSSLLITIRGIPLFFLNLFSFLNRQIPHTFVNPLNTRDTDEVRMGLKTFSYSAIIFLNSTPFNFLKTRKAGRVKRKIKRKVTKVARVVDEF